MKKFLLIPILIFICVGCKAEYNLVINEDLSIEERISGLEDDDFYNQYFNSSKERVMNFVVATKQDYLEENNFIKNEISEDGYYGLEFSKKYDNISDYFNTSIAYKQFYDNWEHTNDDGIITIQLKDKLSKNGNSLDRYMIDEGKISINLPFEVMEQNADSYDKLTNTYYWNINSTDEKKIYIKFDTNRLFKNNNTLYIIVFGGFILTILIIFTFYFIRKAKKNNKF